MPQLGPFASHRRGLDSPATHHLSNSPQNGVGLLVRPQALRRHVSEGGIAAVDMVGPAGFKLVVWPGLPEIFQSRCSLA